MYIRKVSVAINMFSYMYVLFRNVEMCLIACASILYARSGCEVHSKRDEIPAFGLLYIARLAYVHIFVVACANAVLAVHCIYFVGSCLSKRQV